MMVEERKTDNADTTKTSSENFGNNEEIKNNEKDQERVEKEEQARDAIDTVDGMDAVDVLNMNTVDVLKLWKDIGECPDYWLNPDNLIGLCKSINEITDDEKRNTLLQLVLMHANYVIVNMDVNLKQQWETKIEENLKQRDSLTWVIIKHVCDGEFDTALIIDGKKFTPVIPFTIPITADDSDQTRVSLQQRLGIDTTQHIDTINFQAIKLQNYVKDWVVQQDKLYDDVIENDTNFLPENFFNLCAELAKIKDGTTRNILFQRIIDEGRKKMTPSSNLREKRSDDSMSLYERKETNKLIVYHYMFGSKSTYDGFIMNGVTFKKTELTSTQQFQAIYNEPITKNPPSVKKNLASFQRRREKISLHAHAEKKSSSPKWPPKATTLETNTTSLWWLNVGSIIIGNPIFKTYIREGMQEPSSTDMQKWRAEAVREELQEHRIDNDVVSDFIDSQTGKLVNEDGLRFRLQQLGMHNRAEYIINTLLYNIHPDAINNNVEQKRVDFLRDQAIRESRAISQVLMYLKDYLNITAAGSGFNILQNYKLNPSEDIEIRNNKLCFKGSVKSGGVDTAADTPIYLEYDMKTGMLSTNDIVQLDKGAFQTNNTQATSELFQLPPLEILKGNIDPKQSMDDFKQKQLPLDGNTGLRKQELEYKIEKNRTMQYLLSTFDLKLSASYPEGTAWYHLLAIVNNSLITTEQCRLFRWNLEQYAKIIAENKSPSSDLQTSVSQAQNALPEQHDHTTDTKTSLLQKSDFLNGLFSPVKKEKDKINISANVDNKTNGMYLFLKTFTDGITYLEDTSYNERQHLDLVDMKNYLSFIQQEHPNAAYSWPAGEKILQCRNTMLLASEPKPPITELDRTLEANRPEPEILSA